MPSPIETMSLDGGWPCLDFINTVGARKPATSGELLETWSDVLTLTERLGLLPPAEIAAMRTMPDGELVQARALREQLYGIFSHYIATGKLVQDDLNAFNDLLLDTYANTELRMTESGVRRVVPDGIHLDKPLWLMVLSAQNLLLGDKLHRVKACDACGWLFLDTSKNGTRRWCNMAVCGSQVKARNWYQRKKSGG